MTYKEAFEKLRYRVQFALTDYENYGGEHNDTLDKLENAVWLYNSLVDMLNETEDWELESDIDWRKRMYGDKA